MILLIGFRYKRFISVRTQGEYMAHRRRQFKSIPLFNLVKGAAKLGKEKEGVVI